MGLFAAFLIVIILIIAFFIPSTVEINNRQIKGIGAPIARFIIALVILLLVGAIGSFLWEGFVYIKNNCF